jgi:hypothetical protein
MPLANYIVDFQKLDRKAQAKAVIAGHYTKHQLESLVKYADSPTVIETIETMLSHGELPLENPNRHPVAFCQQLDQAAFLVNKSYEILTKPAKAQSRAVIEIGVIMLAVKENLPHGELKKWREENTKLSESWDNYCRRAAQKFIEQHGKGTAAALIEGTDCNQRQVEQAQQLLMDFTGGKGPSALLHDLGIKKRPTPEKADPLPPEERERQLAEADWTEIINTITRHDEDWMLLTDDQIAAIDQLLWPIASSIHKAAKGSK